MNEPPPISSSNFFMLKTPIAYYGGKINMLPHILPLIPEHQIYTEAFFGGGAVFFAKASVRAEVINDTNDLVVNFYEVLKTDFHSLKEMIEATLSARVTYKTALTIYRMPHLFTKLQQAWAFFVVTNLGFSGKIGSWAFDKYGSRVRSFTNKKLKFVPELAERLKHVLIEHSDALKVIASKDTRDTFHYIDPPYIDADQGHYAGYTEEDFCRLLEVLSMIEGKFLLSSYDSEMLSDFTVEQKWYRKEINLPLSASKSTGSKARPRKVEILTANYPI